MRDDEGTGIDLNIAVRELLDEAVETCPVQSMCQWRMLPRQPTAFPWSSILAADIALPGEVRELIVPDRIPVELYQPEGAAPGEMTSRELAAARAAEEPDTVSTQSEAGLLSEAEDIEEQARSSRVPGERERIFFCEVRFTEWTRDDKLRHPRYKGLRRDKDPEDVHKEAESQKADL